MRTTLNILTLAAFLVFYMPKGVFADDFPKNAALDGEIRSLLLNKTKSEIATKYKDRVVFYEIPTEGETISAIKFSLYGSTLSLLLEENKVYQIDVEDSAYHTKKGGRVGLTLKEIVAKYGMGKFYAGVGEGTYITYQVDNRKIVFGINVSKIPAKRFLEDKVKITDPDVMSSVVESIVIRNEVE